MGPVEAAPARSPVELAVIGAIIVMGLYFGQAVLVPLASAVILSFILAPPVRSLRSLGVGNAAAVFLVVAFAFGVIFGIGALITQQVTSLAEGIPRYQVTLKEKVKTLKEMAAGNGVIERASDTLKDLQAELEAPEKKPQGGIMPAPPIVGKDANPRRPIPVEVHAPQPTPLDRMQSIIGIIIEPLASIGLVILFVLFLLMQRVDVRDRAIRLLGSHDLEMSTAAMDDAGQRLSSYFLGLTVINAAYGVFIGLALWVIGVPTPILWGVLAMLMRFVPFIGAIIAAAFPVLLAAAVDEGWTMAAATLALYVVGEAIMGNAIEPVVQGNRTGMSPLAVVLSAAFWTLLWGPIGLILAVPLTVVLVVLGRHVERLAFLHVLLGDTPPLEPPQRFYQRMLAGDPAEAIEQAEELLKKAPLADYYNDVLIEGLRLAQADVDRGALEPERLADVHDAARVVIDTLADVDLAPRERAQDEAEPGVSSEPAEEVDERGDLEIPAAVPAEWRSDGAVVCVASRTPLDHTAALALQQLLRKCGIGALVLSPEEAKHGSLRNLDLADARIICISALDVKERSAHARFLVRRLRRAAPDAVLLGGFWKLDPGSERDRAVIGSIAVDEAAFSIKEAVRYCVQMAEASSGDPSLNRQAAEGVIPAAAS